MFSSLPPIADLQLEALTTSACASLTSAAGRDQACKLELGIMRYGLTDYE
jgi:hypothetical protein